MSARSLPSDLIPLPTQPWNERPAELPLNIDECRTAIWRAQGNITRAAEILKIPSLRLRNFVRRSEFLSAEVRESMAQIVDKAEEIVVEALEDIEDKGRKDAAAKYVLDRIGKDRGWATGNTGPNVNIKNGPGGRINITWGDGSSVSGGSEQPEAMKTIEHNE